MILERKFIYNYVKKIWQTVCLSVIKRTLSVPRGKTYVIFLIIGICSVIYFCSFFHGRWSKVNPRIHPHDNNNITCHDLTEGDSLPDFFDVLKSEEKNIFFVETSCEGGVNSRQACAIESAARQNPEWQINLVFAGPVRAQKFNNSILANLVAMRNVKASRALLSRLVKETSTLELKDLLQRSKYRVSHASDIYRYLILYKYPGVYLDLDMIVARPFGTLARDFVSRERELLVASWALGFSNSRTGRKMARIAKIEIRRTFTPDVWINNGPGVITRSLTQLCHADIRNTEVRWHVDACQGFEIYDTPYFSPNLNYFTGKDGYLGIPKVYAIAYTHHLFNKLSHKIFVNNFSLYMNLARKYCPTVQKIYSSRFGL